MCDESVHVSNMPQDKISKINLNWQGKDQFKLGRWGAANGYPDIKCEEAKSLRP